MVKVQVKKRGKTFQYTFEIAPQDGKRKWITKSGFKSKSEAERAGLKSLNEYLETEHSFKSSQISYTDYLDYWMEEYCYINLKHRILKHTDPDPVHIFTKKEIDLIFDSVKNNHCVYYAFLTAYY